MLSDKRKIDIAVIGGAGHVGFPLGLVCSSKGYKVVLIDKVSKNINKINNGIVPFMEDKSEALLKKMLSKKKIFATNDINAIKRSKYIIVCIGTPINSQMNPDLKKFINFFHSIKKNLNNKHTLIIRSSIYPGIYDKIYEIVKHKCRNITYCPERIVQGKSIIELPKLPQIISGKNKKSLKSSGKLFKKICKKIIYTKVLEAELIKLFSNAYRYINFSVSNQFYMICQDQGLDFFKIRKIMREGYERNHSIPISGFTAGPCLLKDTMQLSSFYNHKFSLGQTAMSINEGLPEFLIKGLSSRYNLKKKIVGVLGLSFKAETDDIRDSLSIKLLKLLKLKKIKTLQSDEYFRHRNNIDKQKLIDKSDIIIIATPHKAYKKLKIRKNKLLVDFWGLIEKK